MRWLGCTMSVILVSPIKDVRDRRRQNAQPNDEEQDQEKRITTQDVEDHEACAEDRSHRKRCHVKRTYPMANDLDDNDPQAQKQKTSQPGQDVTIVAGAQ
jgi:hypothetical protein